MQHRLTAYSIIRGGTLFVLSRVAVIHFAVTFMANSWTLSPAHTGCVCASTNPANKVEKRKMLRQCLTVSSCSEHMVVAVPLGGG